MYLGMILLLLGEAMVFGSVITFLMPLLFMMIIQWRFIPMEENMLDQCFADEFKRYKKQVRRWL
jgi:protein-S-isoprenylcysteine O-methyltransferase Ste14